MRVRGGGQDGTSSVPVWFMSALLRSSGAVSFQARRRSPLALIAACNLPGGQSAAANSKVRSQTPNRLSADKTLSEKARRGISGIARSDDLRWVFSGSV